MTVFNTPKSLERVATRVLPKHGVYRIEKSRAFRVVHCLQGVIWITQEGDWRDRILTPGDKYRTRLPGFILVQAMEESRMEVLHEEAWVSRPIPWLVQRKFNNA